MEAANTQTDLIPGSAVSQQHHRSLCMPNTYPADSQDKNDSTADNTKNQYGYCMTSNKGKKIHNQSKKCWMSKLEEEEGQGAGCLCDPLAQWEQVQWKIVSSVNPWQANYSFDPLGVCITIGGREATDSGAQYRYG